MWKPSLLMNLQDLFDPMSLDLPKINKSKFMALKYVDDVDDSRFDEEISSTEIAYLAKNFKNFL